MAKSVAWDHVAVWYDELIAQRPDSYHSTVVWSNLNRLLSVKPGDFVLDLGSGNGMFDCEIVSHGARVLGVDESSEMIRLAEKRKESLPKAQQILLQFRRGNAENLSFLKMGCVHTILMILSLQNMRDLNMVMKSCSRVLRADGKVFIVLNHPVFRVPQASAWEYDDTRKIQYRRIDAYLSEFTARIETHPGKETGEHTVSYHRSLQEYMKAFSKAGFCITRLEEWISPKTSQIGPRFRAENAARKEFPLFLFIELKKTPLVR